jgi:RND family efflux transporter MFP subunit
MYPAFQRSKYLLLAIVVAPLFSLAGCEEVVEVEEVIRPVRVIRVSAGDELGSRGLPGRARAAEETNLSFDVPGTILIRPVSVGDVVETGQLLARLDQRDYKNQLDAAVAARDRARANFERVEIAARSGAVAKQDLDDSRALLDVRQAEVNIARKAIEDSEIRAPRAGTISATYAEAFTAVRAKEAVLRLLDTSSIEMVVQVPENLISLTPHVTNVRVVYDAFPDRPVPAKIKEISNEASQTTRTFPITLTMEQPEDFKILPGMAGRASADLDADYNPRGGYQIPTSAVFTVSDADDPQRSFVWIVDEESGTVSRREVQTGELERFGIVITDGIAVGDVVVTAGVSVLREGQKVRPEFTERRS